ncbi:hypothetical protein [Aeromonas sobria]|uniref:hypothetical protein n=1 Tax=Aeromonas sobria TaxID=646 RepID=UPI001119E4CC|nr:hypothetical protein [Aeromonas sobria]TNI88757.1 hypothetical protein CF119_01945 [Aeromonas sobria]
MKKTTLWLAMVGALGLAGCGGGGGDSGGGGTTPPEPQPRALPDAGVYLPILMDAQGQLIDNPISDSYRAAGFVYPATTKGKGWAFRIDEKTSPTSRTYAFPNGFSDLNKAAGYPLTLSIFLLQTPANGLEGSKNHTLTAPFINDRLKYVSVSNAGGSSESLWVMDYRTIGYTLNQSALFQNWGGQIALQPMETAPIPDGLLHWSEGGIAPANGELIGILQTEPASSGSGIKLTVDFPDAGCSVDGETTANLKGLNELKLTGWGDCSFAQNRVPLAGKLFEAGWQRSLAGFKDGDSVIAFLTMRPGAGVQPDALLLGIPSIPGFVFEALVR